MATNQNLSHIFSFPSIKKIIIYARLGSKSNPWFDSQSSPQQKRLTSSSAFGSLLVPTWRKRDVTSWPKGDFPPEDRESRLNWYAEIYTLFFLAGQRVSWGLRYIYWYNVQLYKIVVSPSIYSCNHTRNDSTYTNRKL